MSDKSPQLSLIAQVALKLIVAEYERLEENSPAMLRFDCLDRDVLTACINTISRYVEVEDADIEVLLPGDLVNEDEIENKKILFKGNAAAIRNKTQNKRLLVFANGNGRTGEDTLRLVSSIKERDILSYYRGWECALRERYKLNSQDAKQIVAMFEGFNSVMSRGLRVSSDFVVSVTKAIAEDKLLIADAVNKNLKLLDFPKYREAMPSPTYYGDKVKWKKTFETIEEIPTDFLNEQHYFLKKDLETRFREFEEDIKQNSYAVEVYKSLIYKDKKHEWRDLLALEWKSDKLCEFVGLKTTRKKKLDLGKETLNYMQCEASDILARTIPGLDETVQDFLKNFNERISLEEDKDSRERVHLFFAEIQPTIEKNASLEKKWERLLYKKKITGSDFVSLLLQATKQLSGQEDFESIQDPVLLVRCRLGAKKILEGKNHEMIGCFSLLYRSLETLCRDVVFFRMKNLNLEKTNGLNPLFHFSEAKKRLNSKKSDIQKDVKSLSKDALCLDFDVYIISRDEVDKDISKRSSVLVSWYIPKNNIALSLSKDWNVLSSSSEKKKLLRVIFGKNFKQSNRRGLISEITLSDVSSFGLTSGALLCRNGPNLTNLEDYFEKMLSGEAVESLSDGLPKIKKAWTDFVEKYANSVRAILSKGLGSQHVPEMHRSYINLLNVVCDYAKLSQDFRTQAFSCLLSIGVFTFVDNKSSYALVAPWNPMRLFELHREFIIKAGLIRLIIEKKEKLANTSEELDNALTQAGQKRCPNFVVAPLNPYEENQKLQCEELLTPIEHSFGYSLFSRTTGPSCRATVCMNETTVREIADVSVNSYLRLMPDATNWLRILLPDEISPRFPIDVMSGILKELPEDNNLTIAVGGMGAKKYDKEEESLLYQGLTRETAKVSPEEESSSLSNTIKSRTEFRVLRGNGEFQSIAGKGLPPFDVAYIDRFFTYKAKQGWIRLPKRQCADDPYSLNSLIQHRSRRLVQIGEEYTSTTLLVEDEVTNAGHIYVNAVRWLVAGETAVDSEDDYYYYPCLSLNCNSQAIKNDINNLHKVAHWVVTSNNLIDRRQLIGDQIKIVRYKNDARTGKTSIVSSKIPTDLLSERIANRIMEISRRESEAGCRTMANAVLEASYKISGYVALRSARQDRNANEIIGLVLSNWLALAEGQYLATNQGEETLATGSFLLDDFEALASNSKRRADLFCMTLSKKNGRCILHLCITEAKFCGTQSCSEMKSKSQEQLLATMKWLSRVLSDTGSNLAQIERPIWFSRFADMVMLFSKADIVGKSVKSDDIISFADSVNRGDFDLTINGISHVFIHDLDRNAEVERIGQNKEESNAYQVVLGTEDIANLLKLLLERKDEYSHVVRIFKELGFTPSFHNVNLVKPWEWEAKLAEGMIVPANKVTDSTQTNFVSDEEEREIGFATPLVKEPDVVQEQRGRIQRERSSEEDQNAVLSSAISKQHSSSSTFKPNFVTEGIFAPSFADCVSLRGGVLSYSQEKEEWAKKATNNLKYFLLGKGIPAKIKRYKITPNGCLVAFEGEEKLNTREISNLQEALLSTRAINIVFAKPMPGEFLIFFNDASGRRESVSMWTAWNRRTECSRKAGINLSFIVGFKETDGELLYLNPIEHDPHTLIAGTTGSGKTVLMQTMLLDMAATNPSSKLKFYIIDPKGGLDYIPITRLPHMAAPLICEKDEAKVLLQKIVDEMERRYKLFASASAKNLERYNSVVRKEDQLPVLFVIHDELPNWMVQPEYAKSVTSVVTQLATKSRAAGIYLIFLAQRPDKEVLPMQVRDNLGNRLVLKLPANTSEIALGEKGAENLLGKGHMVAKLGNALNYVQVPYLNDDEIAEAVDAISSADREWK